MSSWGSDIDIYMAVATIMQYDSYKISFLGAVGLMQESLVTYF